MHALGYRLIGLAQFYVYMYIVPVYMYMYMYTVPVYMYMYMYTVPVYMYMYTGTVYTDMDTQIDQQTSLLSIGL